MDKKICIPLKGSRKFNLLISDHVVFLSGPFIKFQKYTRIIINCVFCTVQVKNLKVHLYCFTASVDHSFSLLKTLRLTFTMSSLNLLVILVAVVTGYSIPTYYPLFSYRSLIRATALSGGSGL